MPKKKENLSPEERLAKAIIPKEEEPYKVPDNWVWTTSENIFTEISSNNKKIKQKDYLIEGKIPVIDQGKNFIGGYTNNTEMDLYKKELPVTIFGDHTLNLKYIDFPFVIGADGVKVLKTINFYNSKFLYYCIKNLNLKSLGYRRHFPILKLEKFQFPPLEEQKRIVEKLDSLFEKIGKIKEIIEEVKEKTSLRREAVLSKAFTGELTEKWRAENKELISVNKIFERIESEKQELIKQKIIKKSSKTEPITEKDVLFDIPESWKRIKLNEIAFVTKLAGFEYTKNIYPNLVEDGIPLFKGKNVQDGKIIYDFESYIPENISDELPRSQITKKCLLTPYVGTIGNIALFNGSFKAHLGSNVGKIEVFNNFNENILENYLLYYFRSCYGLAQLKKHRKATAQESISIEAIRDCVIVVPPLEEQKEIVRILDKVFEEENKISELISLEEKVEILEKTILDKAFRGELGTGNTDDEPAIELLKRALEENK